MDSGRRAAWDAELAALREQLPTVAPPVHSTDVVYYSKELALIVLDHYAQGVSLHAVSQMDGMPAYATLLRWSKENISFSNALSAVRSMRALHFEDAAISAAENAQGKDADRLKFDAYKWGAEVNDPSRYGKKVTHAGDLSNPIRIVVSTGFGEPNEYQRPPTLNEDGTISRRNLPDIEMKGISSDGEGSNEDRSRDAGRLGDGRGTDGACALPQVAGHAGGSGSEESAPVRGDELRGADESDSQASGAARRSREDAASEDRGAAHEAGGPGGEGA